MKMEVEDDDDDDEEDDDDDEDDEDEEDEWVSDHTNAVKSLSCRPHANRW